MLDEQIVELYWCREEKAIVETSRKYGAYCHTIAQNILYSQEDSEECVNDTWLRAWNTMPPQRPSRLQLFLGKITRHLAFDRYRAKLAQKRGGGEIELVLSELEECIPAPGSVEDELVGKELAQTINRFALLLPERECNLFVRRYFYSETIGHIAKKYGMTVNHAAVSLSRVRQKLKAHLEKEGYTL